jgi:hypothetical protein
MRLTHIFTGGESLKQLSKWAKPVAHGEVAGNLSDSNGTGPCRPTIENALPARLLLGIELQELRKRLGLSQRAVVRLLGLRAHSNLVDYESGRRIPPNDIIKACEKILHVSPGHLERLRAQVLTEEARQHKESQLELLRQRLAG